MTFIGFLLGLAVGAGLMFYLAGSRAQQQSGQAQQGGRQAQQRNRQAMAGRPGFNTEFGDMDDASTNPNNSVKPAALSAAVFAREGSSADLTQKGNQQSAGKSPTDASALESGTVNQPTTGATTMTAYNNNTNPDPAVDHTAAASRLEPGNSPAANRLKNGAGASKNRQKR